MLIKEEKEEESHGHNQIADAVAFKALPEAAKFVIEPEPCPVGSTPFIQNEEFKS